MEALFILGVMMIYISVMVIYALDSDEKRHKIWAVAFFTLLCVGFGLICISVRHETFKEATTNNPYVKEYIYKDSGDGRMVKYDSIYVKKPKS